MKTVRLEQGQSFEVTTDRGEVLGWIDLEKVLDPETGTLEPWYISKPIEGKVRAARSLREATGHMAASCN